MATQNDRNHAFWENIKTAAEVIGGLGLIITILTGPWAFQIPELPYYGSLAALFIAAFSLIWLRRTWNVWQKALLLIVAICVAFGLGYAYWRLSRPSFEITALNTLVDDPQAYEITDFLIWYRDQASLDQYKVETNIEIQIVPSYIGKDRFGEVVARISAGPGSDTYIEKTLWSDFDTNAESKKITLSLAELVEYSGIEEDLGMENRLGEFQYRQSKLYIQIFSLKEPGKPWKTQEITIRNAPWEQRVDTVARDGHHAVDVYLKNYGAPGEFFTHYKLVRLEDLGSTPLEHATNSASTRIENGIIEVEPRLLGAGQSTTFSIPLSSQLTPGRYAVEVYTVKRQRFVNWEVAYSNVSWWFSPSSQTGYFIVKTAEDLTDATPFELEAQRLREEKNIDIGIPIGAIEDVTSPRDAKGQRQKFTNGMVFIYEDQTFSLYGPVYRHYEARDERHFPLSQITTITSSTGETIDFMQFEPVGAQDSPSAIYANERRAGWIEGWIANVYDNNGGPLGWLGLPVSDPIAQSNTTTQMFEYGYIVYYQPEVDGEKDYDRQPVAFPYASMIRGEGKIFDVQAAAWQDTGIEVEEGQLLWIEYLGGTWTDSTETTPDGYDANGNSAVGIAEGSLSDKSVVGALLARIGGDNGSVFAIGRFAVILVPANGRLELGMNDTSYEHNEGRITVKIDVLSE